MRVTPAKYRTTVKEHLRRFRPKEYKRAKRNGTLDRRVNDLAVSIANWVNSQMPHVTEGEISEATLRKQRSALLMSESDAFREYLPRDERDEELIGSSGGYED